MIAPTKCVALIAAMLASACTPGEIYWPGGIGEVRTALLNTTHDGDLSRTDILLSNSTFECTLPQADDPADSARQIESLLVGACREGAVHVYLALHRLDRRGWEGIYTGDDDGAGGLTPGRHRLASGSWVGVQEAFLASFGEVERAYAVESAIDGTLGDGGEVEILGDGDVLRGRFAFPGGIGGSFRAQACDGASDLFDDKLIPDPTLMCP